MNKKISGIYCIENLQNGKKYIGQSVNIYERWQSHKSSLRNNKHSNQVLQRAWNKYGEDNFKFWIIELCDSSVLDEKETHYIKLYNTYIYNTNGWGYNCLVGGMGGGERSLEQKQKDREAQKSNPIYQIDLQGNIVKEWKYGAREASKKLNISQSCIWHCLQGNRKTYKNFVWVYITDYNNHFNIENYINQNTQSRKIMQFDLYGNYIKTWNGANEAAQEGFDVSAIIKNCKQKLDTHKGFIWCYENNVYVTEEYIQKIHKKDYIKMYDKSNNLIGVYKNQMEIVNLHHLSKSGVSNCLCGRIKSTGGYHFVYTT